MKTAVPDCCPLTAWIIGVLNVAQAKTEFGCLAIAARFASDDPVGEGEVSAAGNSGRAEGARAR